MAYVDQFSIPAHPSIYCASSDERELTIHYALPEKGVNEETGLIVFVPGFGGHVQSKVYTKMRRLFADTYNCVTLQCDYFGNSYMQDANSFSLNQDAQNELKKVLSTDDYLVFQQDPQQFLQLISKYKAVFTVIAQFHEKESLQHFNDMGIMQAIDVINAVEAVQIVLKENGMSLNVKKTIGYGHSHGAYLLHLASSLHPNLFSHVIDNSSWIYPQYLKANRYLFKHVGEATLQICFQYIAKEYPILVNNLSVEQIWKTKNNRTHFVMYQGTEDNLVNHIEKKSFFDQQRNIIYNEIHASKVDGEVIRSNRHGLDADFLKFFHQAYEKVQQQPVLAPVQLEDQIRIGEIVLKPSYTNGLTSIQLLNMH